MTNRLFTFGCSFTENRWPTWANILGRQYKTFENWGREGAGNSFIFNSLIECNKRNAINKHDTVIVMWTSIGREDRYVKGEWLTPGSIYKQDLYDNTFVDKYADPTGYLIRDSAFVSAAKSILDATGCQYYFLSSVPFNMPDDNIFKLFSIDRKITKLYAEEFAIIKPSVYEIIFNCNWFSRVGYRNLKKLQTEYEVKRGSDWPTWNKFAEQDFSNTPKNVVTEINENHNFSNRLLYRTDSHPLPTEHVEYIDKVLPDIVISHESREWAETVTDLIINDKDYYNYFNRENRPQRF